LARRGSITAQAVGWIVLDGDPITWRGQGTVDTEPVVIFVNAMIRIIRGVYPHPRKACTGTSAAPATCSQSEAAPKNLESNGCRRSACLHFNSPDPIRRRGWIKD
jgi:hypothetical protein